MTAKCVPTLDPTKLPPISVTYPHPDDFRLRATAARLVISAAMESLIRIVVDSAPYSPQLDGADIIETIRGCCTDLANDVGGAFDLVAEMMVEDTYDGLSFRGPMHRSRP